MPDNRKIAGKSVLVTGGAGFIGSHLSDRLLASEAAGIVIVDDFSLGKRRNLAHLRGNQKVKVVELDASDSKRMTKVLDENDVDVVFNLAVVPLPASLRKPRETFERNVLATTALCELLRQEHFKTLVHCSSSEAYGTALYSPMDEGHPVRPITPYAASKVACDYAVTSYFGTFRCDVAVARPFNTYGPRQNEGSYAGVVPATIRRILNGKAPVIHGDGLQTRDYTYVDDIVDGIVKIYECTSTRGKIVNLATGREVTILELINLIMELTHYKGKVIHAEPRKGDVRRHCGDITLAKTLINYSPQTDLRTGLSKTVEWYETVMGGAK
jgi:UDP-glucose 4-epimerase